MTMTALCCRVDTAKLPYGTLGMSGLFLCSEEERRLTLQVVKGRELQKELSAAEVRSKKTSLVSV